MSKLKYVCDADAAHVCSCGQKAERTVVLEGAAGKDNWTHFCTSCLREALADLRREEEAKRSQRWLQKAVAVHNHGVDPDDYCTSCGYRRGKCKCHYPASNY